MNRFHRHMGRYRLHMHRYRLHPLVILPFQKNRRYIPRRRSTVPRVRHTVPRVRHIAPRARHIAQRARPIAPRVRPTHRRVPNIRHKKRNKNFTVQIIKLNKKYIILISISLFCFLFQKPTSRFTIENV